MCFRANFRYLYGDQRKHKNGKQKDSIAELGDLGAGQENLFTKSKENCSEPGQRKDQMDAQKDAFLRMCDHKISTSGTWGVYEERVAARFRKRPQTETVKGTWK